MYTFDSSNLGIMPRSYPANSISKQNVNFYYQVDMSNKKEVTLRFTNYYSQIEYSLCSKSTLIWIYRTHEGVLSLTDNLCALINILAQLG